MPVGSNVMNPPPMVGDNIVGRGVVGVSIGYVGNLLGKGVGQ